MQKGHSPRWLLEEAGYPERKWRARKASGVLEQVVVPEFCRPDEIWTAHESLAAVFLGVRMILEEETLTLLLA